VKTGIVRLAAVVAVSVLASGAVQAADLIANYGRYCVTSSQSNLVNQSPDVIRQTVWSNLENAKNAMSQPSVLAASGPALMWAMEARWACATAAGYLKSGNFDTESIQKCDCFYQRHLSFR
jgi:hypothetical protein